MVVGTQSKIRSHTQSLKLRRRFLPEKKKKEAYVLTVLLLKTSSKKLKFNLPTMKWAL